MASLNILPGALFLTTNFGINGRKFCKIDLTRLPCDPLAVAITSLQQASITPRNAVATSELGPLPTVAPPPTVYPQRKL